MEKKDWIRYVLVFLITLTLFLSSAWLSSFMNNRKISDIKNIQDKISIDIMSSETQFQLLQEFTCKDVSASSLSGELNSLAEKIAYSEQNINKKEDVLELKKYYSLLQIKDYLLMQKIKEKCNVPVVPIFYFYTTSENCSNCVKEAAVLNKLRTEYPELRVYSFDYNLQLSALQTLIKTFKVDDTKLPALYMNDKLYTGFLDEKEILEILPELKEYSQARMEKETRTASSSTSTTATSAKK
ncbi:hypothetical protein SDC9_33246 [bioreactor metagenome]|uniref:Thioredoxin domain-containing protein n=1 Tax=bioreactor metagenome TaxID=1076179 RepID=A0A644V7R4_9ZZZZ|nr:hypothetical protein [Candidatus Elulimicrobiales bacterium]